MRLRLSFMRHKNTMIDARMVPIKAESHISTFLEGKIVFDLNVLLKS
jgi:hypothetical protein